MNKETQEIKEIIPQEAFDKVKEFAKLLEEVQKTWEELNEIIYKATATK